MKKAVVTGRWFAAFTALTLGLSASARAGEILVVRAEEMTRLTFVRKLDENVEARIAAFCRWRPPQLRWATADKLSLRILFPHAKQWELDNYAVLGRHCIAQELGEGTSVSTLLPGPELLRKSTFSRRIVRTSPPKGEFLEVAVLFRNIASERIDYVFSSGPCSNLDVSVELPDGNRVFPTDFLLPGIAGSLPSTIRSLEKRGRMFVSELALPKGGTIGFTLPPYQIQRGHSLQIHDRGGLPDELRIQGVFPVNRDGTVNLDYGSSVANPFRDEGQPPEIPREKSEQRYGFVRVAGMTLDDATTAINSHLREVLKPPGVSVALDVSGMPQEYLPRVGRSTCALFLFDIPRDLEVVPLRINDAPLIEIPRRLSR